MSVSLLFGATLALFLPEAQSADRSAATCASLVYRSDTQDVEEIAAFVRKDGRRYTPPVAECACAFNLHATIQRELRRRVIRDNFGPEQNPATVHDEDPQTSGTFQLSALLGRRMDDLIVGRQQPFAILPVRVEPPSWIDPVYLASNLGDYEVLGSRMPPPEWWTDMGVTQTLPTGDLATLSAEQVPSEFKLTALRGTERRVLWLDLSTEPDGAAVIEWSLRDITGRPPYPEVAHDRLRLLPSGGALVSSCDDPSSAVVKRWKRKLNWPAGRIATVTTGAVLGAVFGALSVNEYFRFQDNTIAEPGNDLNQRIQERNIGFGAAAMTGAAVSITGLAIPGKVWRRR